MILQQLMAAASEHGLDRSRRHGKERRQDQPQTHVAVLDVERGRHRLAESADVEVEPIPGPG